MSHGTYLKDLLAPLGVYRLEGTLNGGELECIGAALDGCQSKLERIQREMSLVTAEAEGLGAVGTLLARQPVTSDTAMRRAALAALLRVSGDSFTPAALSDNLTGCGLNVSVTEMDTAGEVEVKFPHMPGIPDGFEEMKKIIEDILPCHLLIHYVFWYITWHQLEEMFGSWNALEGAGFTWTQLERKGL